jgi:hypothetical protein
VGKSLGGQPATPKQRDTMQQYFVEVIIGTTYELLINVNNEQEAHNIAGFINPEDKYTHVTRINKEPGRAILALREFNQPPCDICNEAKLDCDAASVKTGEIVQTFRNLISPLATTSEDEAHHLSIVLDAYLTHGVSPCNMYSRA